MNSEMQKRLYEMEVPPPPVVWERLSATIDDINEDNLLAKKVLGAEFVPPAAVWKKIDSAINVVEEKKAPKKGTVINLRRLAAAAVIIGVIASGLILFINIKKNSAGIAKIEPSQQKTSRDTNSTVKKEDPTIIDSPVNQSASEISRSQDSNITAANIDAQSTGIRKNNITRNKNSLVAQRAIAQYASLNEPRVKTFKEPIDDLSLVTSDQNYLTMVNANGRLVKIPTQLASLAPHLQDKPVSEDYYEVLYGQGAYWKETLNEWRKKIVSAPVSPGDAFTSLVELLKNVQNR